MTDNERTDIILDGLADGASHDDIAMDLADRECAAGEYAGCSSDMELAYGENMTRIADIARAVTP